MRLRHPTRVLVLLLVAGVVVLNNYYALKGQIGGRAEIEDSRIYSWLDRLHGSSPHIISGEVFAQGSLWSFSVGGFKMSDPLAVASELSATRKTHRSFLLSTAIPLLAAMLLGRVFCGWICPMGLFSEIVTGLRRVLGRIGVNVFSWSLTSLLKYVVLGVGLAYGLVFSVQLLFWIYPPRIICDILRDLPAGTVGTYSLVFIGTALLLELLFVKRLWCRCLCPGGALYSLPGRWRVLRIRRDGEVCTNCLDCDAACPHDLVPSRKELGGECDNCGLCRASCKEDALHYTLSVGHRGNTQ